MQSSRRGQELPYGFGGGIRRGNAHVNTQPRLKVQGRDCSRSMSFSGPA